MRGATRPDTLGPVIAISVLSLKGGVGKTSVALGLAGAAAKRGLKVLVIDLDPQGNATSILQARHGRANAATVLEHPTTESLQGAITKTAWSFKEGRVDVVGSDSELIRFDAWTGKRSFVPTYAGPLMRLHIGLEDLDDLKASVRALNPSISFFETSCFDGQYITGDITVEYLNGVENQRGEAKPAKGDSGDDADDGQLDLNLASSGEH